MKLICLTLAFLLINSIYSREFESNIFNDPAHNITRVKNPLKNLPLDQLPGNFSWYNVNGISYLTEVRNHHIPNYCGGCYAFASSSSLSDRIKIARNATWPDVIISPQMILSCTAPNRGCHGGSPSVTFEYIAKYGISDETCSPYRARGHENGAPCTDELKCSVCDANGNCTVPESYPVYYVSEHGIVSGEQDMMNEIFQRGPIACSVDPAYMQTYNGTIIDVENKTWNFDHIVSVFGYGEENGVPYWDCRNSWGAFWGIDGFFRVKRGVNSLGIETGCGWAVPIDTWTNNTRNYTNSTKNAQSAKERTFLEKKEEKKKTVSDAPTCVVIDPTIERVPSKFGLDTWRNTNMSDIPAALDWRNFNGVNFLSWMKVENNPFPCGACWVHGTTSALADRIMIQRNSTYPEVSLSSQALINCQGGGDCTGGDPYAVYQYANTVGIPEDSCQNYIAKNPDSFECAPIDVCKNCEPPAVFANGTDPKNCAAVETYENFMVVDYGTLSGVDDMKKAIYAEGPIACGIEFTDALRNYKKGTHRERIADPPVPNQIVSVIGWDVDANGTEYWIVRNSWGTYWGDLGFFNITMGSDNLGIEDECFWATPVLDVSKLEKREKKVELISA